MGIRSRKIVFLESRERPVHKAAKLAAICEPNALDYVDGSASANPMNLLGLLMG
jgi:hypothetical protein